MSVLELHEEVLSCPIIYYHKFMTKYKKRDGKLYIFCEGNVDLGYYSSSIQKLYPEIEIEKAFVECKNNVLSIYRMINWSLYDKNRVLFFVDRDIDYWLGIDSKLDENVYVTDGYSFENDAVSMEMFMECLEEVYGFANANADEKEAIRKIYNKKEELFINGSYYLMASLIVSFLKTKEHYASKIKMSKLIDVSSENVWIDIVLGEKASAYIWEKLGLCEDDEPTINIYEMKIRKNLEHYSVRGKWQYDFLVKMLEYVFVNGEEYANSLYGKTIKEPSRLFDLTNRGGMAYLGPRIKIPNSLKVFITENITKSFAQTMGA